MLNEMIEFPSGDFGLALNLEETEVGVILLGDTTKVMEGDEVKTTGKLLQVPVGKALLGRVVNTLGQPVDNKGPIKTETFYPVEKIAPGIIKRKQRQSAGADRHHGDRRDDADRSRPARADHRRSRDRQIDDRDRHDHQPGALEQGGRRRAARRIIVRSIASTSRSGRRIPTSRAPSRFSRRKARCLTPRSFLRRLPRRATNQYLAPFAGAAMGEWFMDNGMDALIIYDDLSKHAVAYRQVSLVLKRPSGREAYPGDVFYLHSRLLERSARVTRRARRRFAHRAADYRNAGGRRFGLHSDERHLDHRRPDLSRDGFVLPGHSSRDFGRSLRQPRRFGRADQGDQTGRRQDQARSRAVPRARGFRAVRLRSRCGDKGAARSRAAHRRALQAERNTIRSRSRSRSRCFGRCRMVTSIRSRSIG